MRAFMSQPVAGFENMTYAEGFYLPMIALVEYLTEPEAWEVQFAHDMADWGCDLIVGGHAHILQRMEYWNDVPIFYSMGNFCYGGNTDPDDKDSVIVQAEYARDESRGGMVLSDLRVIPCEISSRKDQNDYRPVPCSEGTEDYERILEKLQAFHDTLGEDIKYLSDEEQVSPKKLFSDLSKSLDDDEESTNPELAYLAVIFSSIAP